MATKLYLHRTEVSTPATLPSSEQSTLTADANLFDNEDGSENRRMDTTISAVSQTTLTNTSTGDTSAHNYYIARWVSNTLYQAKIDANTWDFKTAMTASNAAANFPRSSTGVLRVNCYVWRPSTGTKVGTILDGDTAADGEEAGTSQTLIECTFTGAAVTGLTPGDAVLVFELWAIVTQANTSTRTQTVHYDGTTESSTSNNASYIQTPENLRFSATEANATTIFAGAGATSTANTTQYLTISGDDIITTTEAEVQIPIRVAGTLSNLGVRLSANTIAGNTTFTVRKNGSDTSLVATAGASATGTFEDLTNTVSVSEGDKINIKSVPGAATNTFTIRTITLVFTPTDASSSTQILAATGATTFSSASTTNYIVTNGTSAVSSTEANLKVRQSVAGTYSKFFVYVSSNSRTTDTVFKVRKNGSDTSVSVTYTSGQTGLKEDTSNSFTVASGDDVNYAITTSTGTENIIYNIVGIHFTTSVYTGTVVSGQNETINANVTSFIVAGGATGVTPTEAASQRKIRQSYLLVNNLHVYVSANTVSANSTVTLRINGVDSALVATITSNTTGLFSNTSNTVLVGSNDDISWEVTTGATGTSLAIRHIEAHYNTGRVSLASTLLYNILGRISLSRIYKYNILGRISLSRIYKYHVASRVSLARSYLYNILGRVSLSRSYLYNIIGRKSLSRIYKYDVLGRI